LEKGEKLTATQLCKRFLFDDKMQHTWVSKLSGGEKRRLYLLTILMKNPNFFILDEPTNDLDIDTLNVLEDFLESYRGCMLIVTHDRYFMDKLVDHLFIFEGDGVIKDFNGNYQDYLDQRDNPLPAATEAKTVIADKPDTKPVAVSTDKRKPSYKEVREYELLTEEIANLETEKKQLEQDLNDTNLGYEQISEKANRIEQLIQLLQEKEMRWLELGEIVG
jgi:ATP-binding cassette subfamily F protein uup